MIAPSLTTSIILFQSSLTVASPLKSASTLTKAALLTAGRALIGDVEGALRMAGPSLDASDPTGFVGDMVTGLNAIAEAANDQTVLADLRSFIGRQVFNLAQA